MAFRGLICANSTLNALHSLRQKLDLGVRGESAIQSFSFLILPWRRTLELFRPASLLLSIPCLRSYHEWNVKKKRNCSGNCAYLLGRLAKSVEGSAHRKWVDSGRAAQYFQLESSSKLWARTEAHALTMGLDSLVPTRAELNAFVSCQLSRQQGHHVFSRFTFARQCPWRDRANGVCSFPLTSGYVFSFLNVPGISGCCCGMAVCVRADRFHAPTDHRAELPGSPISGTIENDDGQWIRPAKDYASTRYSSLDQVNAGIM